MLSRKKLGLYLALVLLGCSSTNTSSITPEAQTLIGVDPKDFMATGSCGTRIQSYVATLTDVTGPAGVVLPGNLGVALTRFVVGSSPPTPCNESVVFGNVVAYHAYEISLDGYEQTGIEPFAPGSSAMALNGSYIAPKSTAQCQGWTDSDGGVQPGISYPYATVILGNCTKLGD